MHKMLIMFIKLLIKFYAILLDTCSVTMIL